MGARKYGMCARKYCPFGHQTDKLRNDVISSYEVAGFHITAPITICNHYSVLWPKLIQSIQTKIMFSSETSCCSLTL